MKVYAVSRSGNSRFALDTGNLLGVYREVPSAGIYARMCAHDHTKATDEPTWVYEVEVEAVATFKIKKEVVRIDIADS